MTLDAVLLVAAVLIALTVLRRPTASPRRPRRRAGTMAALYAGLVLTVTATVAPYLGHVLADHIRHGYPTYSDARVDTAVTAWLVILSIVGALGVVGWVTTIWAVRAGKSWARWVAAVLLGAGLAVALSALLIKDTSGEVGLAPLLGEIGILPCVAGVAVVALLFTRRARSSRRPPIRWSSG